MIKPLAVALSILAIAGTTAYQSGIRVNLSESLPGLIWRLEKLQPAQPVRTGQIVFICPPDSAVSAQAKQRGYWQSSVICPGNHPPLIKPVMATAGDRVAVDSAGVWINGALIPQSTPRIVDRSGRELPDLTGMDSILSSDQLWLLSTHHSNSFDSRYFGPLDSGQVLGIGHPIF